MSIPEIMIALLWSCMVTAFYTALWFVLCWDQLKKDYATMQREQRVLDLAFT